MKVLLAQDVDEKGKNYLLENGYELVLAPREDPELMKELIADCDAVFSKTFFLTEDILKAGKKSVSSLKKKPYIEITDLSGIQADVFAGYLGGEVRLAIYFDGKEYHPISGFSFSTSITDAIDHMYLSKEKDRIMNYEGPKMIRIENVKIL